MKISLKNISRKRLFIGLGIGLVLIIIVLRNLASGGDPAAAQLGPPIAVEVEEVGLHSVEQTVTAAGKIQPVFETEISSTVSAQIMAIRVDEGYEVTTGDTLIILDRRRYEAAYERSQSALRSAEAGLRRVTSELERSRQLYEKDLISQQEMETLEASYEQSLSQKEQAEASLDQAADDLDKTILIAPEGGIVTQLNKEVGEMAQGSTFQAEVLLVISDLSMMEVVVEVDETDVVDIELMDPVDIEVDALQDTVFSGRVSKIAHSALVTGLGTQNQVTNFEVVVTLDVDPQARRVDPRIRPGMSATATITTALHNSVVAVPIQALTARQPVELESNNVTGSSTVSSSGGSDGGSMVVTNTGPEAEISDEDDDTEPVEVVFVVARDTTGSGGGFLQGLFGPRARDRVVQREVEIGISSDTHYEILSGLEPGEEIVIGNYRAVSRDLEDGRRITRLEESTSTEVM